MSRTPIRGLPIEAQPDEILFAMVIWGEARGEDSLGKLAVAWVIKNRAIRHGHSLRSIILQPWQFSSLNANDPNRAMLLEPLKHDSSLIWEACWFAAQLALSGTEPDPTNGADHYCTAELWGNPTPPDHTVKWWHQIEIESGRTVETARIGRHVFAKAA